MSQGTEDTVYLSPHLDDVALSCGGQIARASRRGEPARRVLTLFAGDEPAGVEPSALVESFHRAFGVSGGVAALRRVEDRASCERLGAIAEHWELPDSIYRRHPESGEPLYSDLQSLFGPIHAADERLIEDLAGRLRDLGRRQLVAPLAVGEHVDHRIVRRAAERACDASLLYYEDFPYVAKWGALRRRLRGDGPWSPQVIPLERADVEAKIAAVSAFRSQERLFGSFPKLARKIRRRARRLRGERMWRRGS